MTHDPLPDPGPEATDKLLEDLEAYVFKPTEIARAARRLRAHIQALRQSTSSLLEHVEWVEDAGPVGSGWKSDELRAAIEEAKRVVGQLDDAS